MDFDYAPLHFEYEMRPLREHLFNLASARPVGHVCPSTPQYMKLQRALDNFKEFHLNHEDFFFLDQDGGQRETVERLIVTSHLLMCDVLGYLYDVSWDGCHERAQLSDPYYNRLLEMRVPFQHSFAVVKLAGMYSLEMMTKLTMDQGLYEVSGRECFSRLDIEEPTSEDVMLIRKRVRFESKVTLESGFQIENHLDLNLNYSGVVKSYTLGSCFDSIRMNESIINPSVDSLVEEVRAKVKEDITEHLH